MKTKSLVISTCKNGWIVSPWPPLRDYMCGEVPPGKEEYWVYRDIRDLQAELPRLLGHEHCEIVTLDSTPVTAP